jgi:phage shock protein PspC (stress-responsive transcriptional regulator)
MKKTLTVNLSGLVFHIDEDAYLKLNHYLDSIKAHLNTTTGRDEIIADIENRIAELFTEKKKSVISIADVEEVITIMGQPEDYVSDEEEPQSQRRPYTTSSKKRLYRDPDNQVLGGVCSGIGHFTGIDPVWVRLIFLALLFSGVSAIFYFVLWIVIPKALSTAQKLQMKGKAATFSNIEDYVKESYRTVRDDLKSVDLKGAQSKAQEGAKGFFAFLGEIIRALFTAIGRVLSFIGEVLGKLLGVIIIAVTLVLLIAITVSFIIGSFIDVNIGNDILMLPGFQYMDHNWGGPYHPIFYHISMLLTFGIPAFSLLLIALQLLFKNMGRLSGSVKIGMLAVWMLALIAFIVMSFTRF